MHRKIIGEYIGQEKGPLFVIFGAMHGNEPAGVKAIDLVLKMLEVEPIKNPSFSYKGALIGINANTIAYSKKTRFVNRDLNRCWTKDFVEKAISSIKPNEEELEIRENISIIRKAIKKHRPEKIVFLDLHTTSSTGGIFSIVGQDKGSLEIAKEMYAPVILGLLEGLKGTTLHYFTTENIGVKTAAITFESGQHKDPLSINRAIAGIVNCMRTIGAVNPSDVENQHDNMLKKYSIGLPNVSRLKYSHSIEQGKRFRMKEGYKNFQNVNKNEILAYQEEKEIRSLEDGLILMPLYQEQGEDGFFIIKEVGEN